MEDFKHDRSASRYFLKKCFYASYRKYLQVKRPQPVTILFYPQWPSWKSGMHKILMNLEIGVTNNFSDPFTKAFFWEDRTFRERRKKLGSLRNNTEIINFDCTDISKENVEKIFDNVFGYPLRVNPSFKGKMVRKSNFNSKHDGLILEGPIARKKGFVYEKLLNNEAPDGSYQDMRITYFRGIVPFVSLRYHKPEERFGKVFRATVEKVEDYISASELEQICEFCSRIGLEYGDLDMIRDNDDGRLYVLDANPTPSQPPKTAMTPFARKLMVEKWSEAFLRAFLSTAGATPVNKESCAAKIGLPS